MADRKTKIKSSQIFDNGVMLEDLNEEVKVANIAFVVDNGSNVIETGDAGDIQIPFGVVIDEVSLLADQTGSIVVDIFKDTYANYPPSTSITASAKPTISSAIKVSDSSLVGWSKSINGGDVIRFNVDSCTSITRCTINLKVKRV